MASVVSPVEWTISKPSPGCCEVDGGLVCGALHIHREAGLNAGQKACLDTFPSSCSEIPPSPLKGGFPDSAPSSCKGGELPAQPRSLIPSSPRRKDHSVTVAQLEVKNKMHISRFYKHFTAPVCAAVPGNRWLCGNSCIPEKPQRKTRMHYCSHMQAACHQLFNHAVGRGALRWRAQGQPVVALQGHVLSWSPQGHSVCL